MKTVLVHNYYQQAGGEDEVFEAEAGLLERNGHSVVRYIQHNDSVAQLSRLQLARKTVWNSSSYSGLRKVLAREKPEVLHVHNHFPLLSPSVYYAAREEGVPVVQTLHNPRLMCPASTFYREEKLCTSCLGKPFAWPGVVHGCYRGSRLETLGVAGTTAFHRLRGTWANAVDTYIASTGFYRDLFVEGGLPREKMVVKPHFVWPDPGPSTREPEHVLYIGRLEPAKGVRTLTRAWAELKRRGVSLPLKVRGSGELLPELEAEVVSSDLDVEFVGRLPREELTELIKKAYFLVWPSEGYYETFGLVAVEAFACGIPVIAADVGVATANVADSRTGMRFRPGDPIDLADKVERMVGDDGVAAAMRGEARAEYLSKYTAESNYQQLMSIYERAAEAA